MSSRTFMCPYSLRAARADEGIDLMPQNLRILWSRIRAARAESHHVAAQQLAIGRSGGVFSEHKTAFATMCSLPEREVFQDLQRVRLGAKPKPKYGVKKYVRERRKSIDQELLGASYMTGDLGTTGVSPLPVWSVKAAGAAMHHNARIHHIMRYFRVDFTPNNVRIFRTAVQSARLEQHHTYARQIALVSSGGYCTDYAQALVRWTALETAEAAEKEYLRICRETRDSGNDPRAFAIDFHRNIVAQMIANGIFDIDGNPAQGTSEHRGRALTSAHVAACYDHEKPHDQSLTKLLQTRGSEKDREKQEADAKVDGMLSWLDDELECAGKTLSADEPSVVSRLVMIHAAPLKMESKTGATDEEIRHKMRGALSRKMQIGPALNRHRIDEIYAQLFAEAPWHAHVIEWLWRRHLETLDDPERCAYLPPSLIIGPPGCGKTFMMTRLAELLDLPAVRMDMTGSLEPWSIAGGAWGWRNAQPGLAVKTILESGFANPFLLLDELEKAGKSHVGGPLTALLPLLQRETARTYRCPYLEAEIDLSRVTWVMLGNSLAQIGGPLRDRVTVNMARGPEGTEINQLAERLLGDLVADQQVIDAAIAAMQSRKMSLRGLHRLAREFRAIDARPQLN